MCALEKAVRGRRKPLSQLTLVRLHACLERGKRSQAERRVWKRSTASVLLWTRQ